MSLTDQEPTYKQKLNEYLHTEKVPWWFGHFANKVDAMAAIQDAIFFKVDHTMQTDYEQEQSRKQINYAPNVVNDYRIRDQQNADRAKFNTEVVNAQRSRVGFGGTFETSIGAAGTYFSVKGNALHNELYWKGKTTGKFYTTGKYGTTNYLKTRGGYANSYKVIGKPLQAAKSLGTKLGAAGLLITGYDIVMGDGLTTSNVLDATFGAAGFIPGIGWAISGSYFLINTGVQLYSGKNIGEHWDD